MLKQAFWDLKKIVLVKEMFTRESFKNVTKCLFVVRIMVSCLLLEGIYNLCFILMTVNLLIGSLPLFKDHQLESPSQQ